VRMAAEEKQRKLKWRMDVEAHKEERKREKAEDRQIKLERRQGQQAERKSRAEGIKFLRDELEEKKLVREAEDRIYKQLTGRDLVRKHANRRRGDEDSDDDDNVDYLEDSDEDDASIADDESTASYKPKKKKSKRTSTTAKEVAAEVVPVKVTTATFSDPRIVMTDNELEVLLYERKLDRRAANETHPDVVARLAAADDDLSATNVKTLLDKLFVRPRGNRANRLNMLREADAANSAAGKQGVKVGTSQFEKFSADYAEKYAHLISDE
jgi:hypothetical protein